MTTLTHAQIQSNSPSRVRLLTALFGAVLGLTLITLTGHVQASAHDVRHATGFPCH